MLKGVWVINIDQYLFVELLRVFEGLGTIEFPNALIVIGTSISHGALKHASYPQAIKCFNDGKFTLNFFDSENRYIQFCMINKSTFAIRVLEKVTDGKYEEITAFVQKGIKSLEELENFVLRRGYTLIDKLP